MKTIKEIYDERVEGFENEFVHYEVMGSTLNDGTKTKWNRTPQDGISHNHQTIIALLEGMVEWLEGQEPRLDDNEYDNDAEYSGYYNAKTHFKRYLKEQIEAILDKWLY